MATCPSGHESADDDFCDVCGIAIGPAAVPSTIAAVVALQCPHCGVPRAGQFCESCGYDFTDLADGGVQAPPVTRVEPAPARFSTTTGLPRRSPNPGVNARQSVSIEPPAGQGAHDGAECPGGAAAAPDDLAQVIGVDAHL